MEKGYTPEEIEASEEALAKVDKNMLDQDNAADALKRLAEQLGPADVSQKKNVSNE